MDIDLTCKISGQKKRKCGGIVLNGSLNYLGEFENKITHFIDETGYRCGNDKVLIAIDATKIILNRSGLNCPMLN